MAAVSPFFLTNNFGRLKNISVLHYFISYIPYFETTQQFPEILLFAHTHTHTGSLKVCALVILSSLTFHQWFTLWSPAHVPSWRVKSRCADLRSASSCHCDCALFGVLSVWSAQSTDHLILHTGELIISDLFCVIYSSGHFLYPG